MSDGIFTRPLTRQDLDQLDNDDDIDAADLFVLVPDCHKDSPVMAGYERARGILHLKCAECGDTILVLAIAARPETPVSSRRQH